MICTEATNTADSHDKHAHYDMHDHMRLVGGMLQ